MTARKTDPRDARIAELEEQVADLVDALVRVATEHPACQLPHYPMPAEPPAPVTPWPYPPVFGPRPVWMQTDGTPPAIPTESTTVGAGVGFGGTHDLGAA